MRTLKELCWSFDHQFLHFDTVLQLCGAGCVCTCLCVCVLCMCAGACAQGYRGQRSTSSAFCCCSTSVFRAGSLTEAGAQGLAALASQPQGCFCLPPQLSLPNTSFYLRAAHQVQVHMLEQQGLSWLRPLLSPLCGVHVGEHTWPYSMSLQLTTNLQLL